MDLFFSSTQRAVQFLRPLGKSEMTLCRRVFLLIASAAVAAGVLFFLFFLSSAYHI